MAKANVVSLCKKCGAEIQKGSEQCPLCRAVQNSASGSPFGSPDYAILQFKDMVESNVATMKDDERKAKVEEDLRKELALWYRSCPDTDKIAAMEEAFNMLKEILLSPVSVDTIKKVTKTGKRIGEIAASIENYASKGGSFNAPTTTGSTISIEDINET